MVAPWVPALLTVRGESWRPWQDVEEGWSVAPWGPVLLLSVRGGSRRPWPDVVEVWSVAPWGPVLLLSVPGGAPRALVRDGSGAETRRGGQRCFLPMIRLGRLEVAWPFVRSRVVPGEVAGGGLGSLMKTPTCCATNSGKSW